MADGEREGAGTACAGVPQCRKACRVRRVDDHERGARGHAFVVNCPARCGNRRHPERSVSRHFGTVVNAGLRGPRRELLLQADGLSAGPVCAEPDAEQVIERIICRPVREHPGIPGKFIKQALRPEQPVVNVILGRGQRPPPVTPLPFVAVERCRLLRSPGPVKRKQDIDSQSP